MKHDLKMNDQAQAREFCYFNTQLQVLLIDQPLMAKLITAMFSSSSTEYVSTMLP